jgi:hypothetical protein
MNVAGRTFLRDFMDYLGDAFTFHRLLPHGLLKLNANSYWLNEQYVFQNLIAIRR